MISESPPNAEALMTQDVGMASRSDVIRQIAVERSRAGVISDYYRLYDGHAETDQRIHRVPVVAGEQLVGIISSLDIVELVGKGPLARTPS